ncbi:MAG: hypothetical protein AAFX78_03630 [Cyanobacteria bacterium J06638_20]
MASLTRTIYDRNGQAFETLTDSDGSVTERVIAAQESRFEAQMESNAQEPYTLWDGNGRIRQVGGNNAYRPRGVQANGGFGAGDPVQVKDGLVSATPRMGNTGELRNQIKAQAETITTVAKNLPGQYGNGDPNTETTPGTKDVLPRYPNDTYYDKDAGTLFIWDTDSEAETPDPKWVPLFEAGLRNGFGPPTPSEDDLTGYYDGQLYYDAGTGSLWRWDADLSTDPSAPSWVCVAQSWNLGSGTPADSSAFIDGAIAVSGDKIYIGSVANGWSEFSGGGGGVQSSYLVLGSFTNPSSGSVALSASFAFFDEVGVYDSNDNTKIFLPSAGVYEIQLRVQVKFTGITDERYTGQWAFSCLFYDDSDVQTGGDGNSNHEAYGVNAAGTTAPVTLQNATQFIYPTFWVNTTGTATTYATIFARYRVLFGGSPSGATQPATASMQGRTIVKKLS